jgi:lysophospholipase L1-like esterase
MGWRRILKYIVITLLIVAALIVGVLLYQGKQAPTTNSSYVALGSSFAAGFGLGDRVAGSPLVCQRSINGYPQHLARETGLEMTDVSCSGATVSHVLRGGQVFLGPQIDAIGPDTQLVTLTAGGNDVSYVGDLMAMAQMQEGGFVSWLLGQFWDGPKPVAERPFDALEKDMVRTFAEIRRRAPNARIIVALYPTILPKSGTCAAIGIDTKQADMMRSVAARLTEVTKQAAAQGGAILVDMAALSDGHDACTAEPWVNGAAPVTGAPFHPTLAGAIATKALVKAALGDSIVQNRRM